MITHSISLIGKRDNNEDQHDIIINLDGKNNFNNINYFAVYDGHGGKQVSKYLKENLSNYFTSKYKNYNIENINKFKSYVNKVYDHIQTKLETKFKVFSYNVGSTALNIIFYKSNNKIKYYINNVGDCRCVKCNKNNIAIPLTKDHKPNSYDEKKRIEKLDGKIYFDGYDWRIGDLSVSRAFGDIDNYPYVSYKPDIYNGELKSDDKFIILACDGLWDVLSNQDVIDFILEQMDDIKISNSMLGNSINNIAYNLGNYAINKGSLDNISIVIIFNKSSYQ